jgi:hypothetical protein
MNGRTALRRSIPEVGPRSAGRPILLATLGVPFDDAAVAVAVDAAVESGEPLVVANVTRLEPLWLSIRMGYDSLEELTPDVSRSVRRPAEVAAGFGLAVERLRVRSPRPISALRELVRERKPGLLVFGPDPRRLSPRRFRKAAAALREGASCLVWIAGDPDSRGPRSVG